MSVAKSSAKSLEVFFMSIRLEMKLSFMLSKLIWVMVSRQLSVSSSIFPAWSA